MPIASLARVRLPAGYDELLSALLFIGTSHSAQLSGSNNCGTPDEPKPCKHGVTHKATTTTHKATDVKPMPPKSQPNRPRG
jgi:hypothetical protein